MCQFRRTAPISRGSDREPRINVLEFNLALDRPPLDKQATLDKQGKVRANAPR